MTLNYLRISPIVVVAIPDFQSTDKPDVDDITYSSVTVSWSKARNIPSGLEDHYFYLLWLQADGEADKIIDRIAQGPGKRRIESRITRLKFNTNYSIRVKPYRRHGGEQEGGTATGVTRFKTSCKGIVGMVLWNNVKCFLYCQQI